MKTPEQIAAETAKKIVQDGLAINTINAMLEGCPSSISSLNECANDYILAALTEHAKGLAYGNGQHTLVCEDLGCSADPDAPGPSAHEAVQNVIAELTALRARVAELEARILADNKAYGCELRDPYGTIWEYAETLKKRISELELQTFDIKALEADKARLDAGLTKLYDELEGYEDGAPDAGPKSQLANACLPTIRSLLAIVRAAIDTARTAQPAANTGDNHRTEDKL